VTCGPPPVFPHSSTSMPMGAYVNREVTFTCNDGFYLTGSATARCMANKQWQYDGGETACLRRNCYDPPQMPNGGRKFVGTLYESTADYFCDEGYTLSGQSSLVCGISGHWEGKLPTCELLNCGAPPFGNHVVVSGDRYPTYYNPY
jgi:CUB/sushi domain-containing protein